MYREQYGEYAFDTDRLTNSWVSDHIDLQEGRLSYYWYEIN